LADPVPQPPAILIDAHVHLHDCYQPARFLEQAAGNFDRASRDHDWAPMPGALLLTESAGVDWFARLAGGAADTGPWSVETTADGSTLLARDGHRRLLLVAGRQVVTREGLEVLLLGTRGQMPDGQSIRAVLAEGERLGALRVVPWGAGKWHFGRGRLLDELIDDARPGSGFFLGDGGGRPFFWGDPRHFERAARRGIRVLRGTDPLPFPSQVARPGSFGFRLAWPEGPAVTGETIKAALRRADARLTPYGRLERLVPFVRDQIAMQRRKRGAAA
jgi:hypothetical protein